MPTLNSMLVVALCATATSGCVLKWDRQWPDVGAPLDGPGDQRRAPDSLRPDVLADSKVKLPDMSAGPCKGKPPGTVCRKSSDDCDIEETCSDKSDTCPPDKLHPEGKVCRTSLNDCDPEEICSGKSDKCPKDVKWTNKTMTIYTTKKTDGFVAKFGSSTYKLTTSSVRAYCRPYGPVEMEIARGFLSFDTKALGASAVVSGATLTGCFMGAPNAKTNFTNLYPATFKLPATVAIYKATTGSPITQMPRNNGANTFTVPITSIKPGALTQYQLRWPIVSCAEFTGQAWSGASNTVTGICPTTPYPWKLEIKYCGP